MFDINALINNAITTAVTEAIKPLVERIEALEKNEEYLTNRIAALENNPAIGVDTTLEKRVAVLASQYTPISNEQFKAMLEEWDIGRLVQRVEALETNPADTPVTDIVADAFVTHLDNQEWFWEKLTRKAKEVADAAAERAMEEHTEEFNHDSYDDVVSEIEDIDFDDFAKTDDIRDAVRDAVQDLSFEIRVR